jgi:unsaturated rhamnogalacturonyl hydrolase
VNRHLQPIFELRRPGAGRICFGLGKGPSSLIGKACISAVLVLCWSAVPGVFAQTPALSVRLADSLLQRHPGSSSSTAQTWDEETGTRLEGLEAEWYNTANGDYFRYAKQAVDSYLDAHTPFEIPKQPGTQMADALLGRQLLRLYRVTQAGKYYDAASQLRNQLSSSCGVPSVVAEPSHPAVGTPKNPCVAAPFLAEYASVFHQAQDFPAITKYLIQWDEENRGQPESRPGQLSTGVSRGDAWLAAALVDTLPYYPQDDPGRAQLIAVLNRVASAVKKEQDSAPGALEIYAMLKGVRLGYLPARFSAIAAGAWAKKGNALIDADPGKAGTGALLLAATEADLASTATLAHGQTVMVDAWFNSQQRQNAAGQMDYFHYKWSDFSDSGYSLLGHMFESYGMTTEMLDSAPAKDKLSKSQFYIIVSPDIPIKNPNPHYMTEHDAAEIASWVHEGGVLILMENDPPNADITHLNLLADRFGIHFDDVLTHHILGEHVEDGTIPVAPDGKLFLRAHTLYMKDTCNISLRQPATALLRDRGGIVMATAKYGRGTVFAAVDPWLYNEYTDGRKNPHIYGQFDNFAGGKELVRWLLEQHPRAEAQTGKR